jgi:16S rRNA G1207 methylase RsmC
MPIQLPPGLKRFPLRKHEPLQAWDAADELLLEHLNQNPPSETARILILNDAFGALTVALQNQGADLTSYTDSFVAALSMEANAASAGTAVQPIHDLKDLKGAYDWVAIRVPKNMSFFEDELCHLSGHLHTNSRIVCGYMIKHQAEASFKLLERIVGPTTTSLARKKARLIFADFAKKAVTSPYPRAIALDGFDAPFIHGSNLFSGQKLDIGTRFLLEHIPQGTYRRILDLGCGNGVVGIAAQRLNPDAQLSFCDESSMAVESARANYADRFPSGTAEFSWTDCCESASSGSFDLILCNPPFHQNHAVGDQVALRMFKDAHRALAPGGLLRVIGNSHLHYPESLRRLFGESEIVSRNAKFTIADSIKQGD